MTTCSRTGLLIQLCAADITTDCGSSGNMYLQIYNVRVRPTTPSAWPVQKMSGSTTPVVPIQQPAATFPPRRHLSRGRRPPDAPIALGPPESNRHRTFSLTLCSAFLPCMWTGSLRRWLHPRDPPTSPSFQTPSTPATAFRAVRAEP
jgi:hypothetical protein